MPRHSRLCIFFLTFLLAFPIAEAQNAAPRVVTALNLSDVTTLVGNVPPQAQPEFDQGIADPDTRMDRMVLVLAPSPEQQAALDALTQAQQDPDSPLYHRWLSPEEYGQRFGLNPADLAKVTRWLQSSGFQVEPVAASRRILAFSGTAAQVADAFHVELHRFLVKGEAHLANTQDPQIPRALAPVLSGVLSLHDFRRTSQIASRRPVTPQGQGIAPQETQSPTVHYLFPDDFATIYDLNPLFTAGTNGKGVSIAIVGRSNINASDIASFRTFAALPANAPTVVLDGADPGLIPGDQDEATLDVEWSGAVAPAATVKLVVAASTATTDGVDLAAAYIVNNKLAPVMSTSFGNCEANMGTAELAFYNSLWQQAASEGISAFVSSGDSGAAGCNGGDAASGSVAGINGLCSSPYATCVGGTEFQEGTGNYWSATNGPGGSSALSYIPEAVWNESANAGGSGLWASGGGISQVSPQPAWQQQILGASGNGMRTVPDVALTAALHDGYLVCENNNYYVFAGTSASSPSFAGILSLAVQQSGGGGQGSANSTLYKLLSTVNPFHPTPSGSNTVPGVHGFIAAGAPYNLATGLGSVDANTLVTSWPKGGFSGTPPGFTLYASVKSETLLPGASASVTVALAAQGGFSGVVALTVTAPKGVTASVSPAALKPGQSATLQITVTTSAAPGTGAILLTGTSSLLADSVSIPITVQAPPSLSLSTGASTATVVAGKTAAIPVTLTTAGAFTGAVVMAVSGLPSGVTATWSKNNFAPGAASTPTTLTLTAATTAAPATAQISITATSGTLLAKSTVALTVAPAPAIKLTLSATSLTMNSTATQALTASVALIGGVKPTFPSGSTFAVAGLPAGITGSWSAPVLVSTTTLQATLTLTGSNLARAGNSVLNLNVSVKDAATGVSFSASQPVSLLVTMKPSLAFTGGATSLSITRGQTVADPVAVTNSGTFTTPVSFSVSALPAGVTSTWSVNPVTPASYTGTASASLSLKTTTAAKAGSYRLIVTASGSGVSATQTLTFTLR